MSGKRYTEEQVIYAIKQAECGTSGKEIGRQMGVSESTFYAWRKKYDGMGVSEQREAPLVPVSRPLLVSGR